MGYNGLDAGYREVDMQIVEIQLADIDPDDAYAITYPQHPERYAHVLERFPGIPLLVVDKARRVVCGHDYRLLLLWRGESRVQVLQVELSPHEGLLLNFSILERLFGLNLYEKLLFVKKASLLLPLAEIQRRAKLDFPLDEPLLRRLDLLLSEPFRSCLATGRLGLKTALKLAAEDGADREAQLAVFQACCFSENLQWQVVQILEELAFMKGKPVAILLKSRGLRALLKGEMPQRKFMEALNAMRYPLLSRMENEWRQWQKEMRGPGVVCLAHAPHFASGEVRVTLAVKDKAAAERLLRQLKKSPAH